MIKLKRNGVEIKSPILKDIKSHWTRLRDVCLLVQLCGGKANGSCGGHVHIGKNILGVDSKAWQTLKNIWVEAEPLLYTISNRRGEKTRTGADRYAKSTASQIKQVPEMYYRIESEEDIKKLAHLISREDRYLGLNLSNLSYYGDIDTIEFRISNGTVDYNIWRENMLLYARLLQTAKLSSISPALVEKKLKDFMEEGLTEEEKICRFLDLIFEKDEEKEIFYKRWEVQKGKRPDDVQNKANNKNNEIR